MMQRFNRSIFGLMEMCNTGAWVKADDADEKIRKYEVSSSERFIEVKKLEKELANVRVLNLELARHKQVKLTYVLAFWVLGAVELIEHLAR